MGSVVRTWRAAFAKGGGPPVAEAAIQVDRGGEP
jgi:hypothetical protein